MAKQIVVTFEEDEARELLALIREHPEARPTANIPMAANRLMWALSEAGAADTTNDEG